MQLGDAEAELVEGAVHEPWQIGALFFVVLTIPLARLTDWLQRRTAERERAGAR